MKIQRKQLQDLVLDGEKISSLADLREHPSTELLSLYQDGTLQRWLRTHEGTAEADKLGEITLSGEQAQDLFAVCQSLGIDVMLEDIADALREEENAQQDTESTSCVIEEDDTGDDDLEDDPETDDPTVSDWMEQFEEAKKEIDAALVKSIYDETPIATRLRRVYTNIVSPEQVHNVKINHIEDTEFIKIPAWVAWDYGVNAAIFEGKNIGLYFAPNDKKNLSIDLIFVKGENVILNLGNWFSYNTCIFAKNIYVYDLWSKDNRNMVLIGDNIFIESLNDDLDKYYNNYIYAKNVISIGRGSLFPPFSKDKLDSWISDKTYSSGTIDKKDNVYLSAPQYLYDSQKHGNFMHPLIANKLFNAVKKSYLNWTSDPSFYSANRTPLGGESKRGFFGFF